MPRPSAALAVRDLTPTRDSTLQEILDGLLAPQKNLPAKLLYDERGSELFERICELDEYYLTRTELAIMRKHSEEMAAAAGRDCLLIEYGSGSSLKTQILLDALVEPVAYVPIDISLSALEQSAQRLTEVFPEIPVLPVCADYTADYAIPDTPRPARRPLVYFPGSTIGNLAPDDACEFLGHIAQQSGPNGGVLIGVDLHKDTPTLEAAYADAAGVTAEFELNVLEHINREFGGDFDLGRFEYESFYNETLRRIEMYLVSSETQVVHVGDTRIPFEAGERILAECSHKFSRADFASLSERAGLRAEAVWTDRDDLFSVQFLSVS